MVAGGILVVDDEDHIRDIIRQALSDEGYQVVEAANGAEALSLLDEWSPDLILLDLWMPVVDGWQFLVAYGQQAEPRAPVIAMTAVVSESGEQKSVAAAGYLPKPFDIDELMDTVREFTSPSRPSSRAVH